MEKLKKTGFINALGVLVYIALVSVIMTNADKLFGKMENYLGPIAFLLLFTLSAIVVGGLVIGKPLMLYLDGKKKESIAALLAVIGWLAVFTIIAIMVLILIK